MIGDANAWATTAWPSGARIVEVALGERAYPIHIGAGLLRHAGALIEARMTSPRAVIVTNAAVAAHWLEPLVASLEAQRIGSTTIVVGDGESHKTLGTVEHVLTQLIEQGTDRTTTVIALGGGVIGDIAGFSAAVYQRGIPFVQVPTTLLSQVDSSVGGKTGVNHSLGKNMIGAFHQPDAVIIDTDCLATLPEREFAAGLAEVIKYGAIRDVSFFEWLEVNLDAIIARDANAIIHAIAESCRIKAAIVAADERETGERALLNFGHTFGHAIETGVGYGEWLHGEAVAAGMVMAANVSVQRGDLSEAERDRLRRLLDRAGLPVIAPRLGVETYRQLMRRDKKVLAGAVRFILLRGLGDAYVTADLADTELNAVLR